MKQAIIVRKDLKMSCGKIAGQVAHASVRALINSSEKNEAYWFEEGETKIVLKVYSEDELKIIATECFAENIPYALVQDLGKTQIPEGTLTAIGIGPTDDEIIDDITQGLKLL
jgi:PTH2 family peptidyl-tRNA hydrolase